MWGLWGVIRWWEWYPHEWRECLVRGWKDRSSRDSPGSPWLGLRTSSAGGASSTPGQGTKIPHAVKNQNQETKRARKKDWSVSSATWGHGGKVAISEKRGWTLTKWRKSHLSGPPQFWKQDAVLWCRTEGQPDYVIWLRSQGREVTELGCEPRIPSSRPSPSAMLLWQRWPCIPGGSSLRIPVSFISTAHPQMCRHWGSCFWGARPPAWLILGFQSPKIWTLILNQVLAV